MNQGKFFLSIVKVLCCNYYFQRTEGGLNSMTLQ